MRSEKLGFGSKKLGFGPLRVRVRVRVSRPHKRLRILRVPAQYSSRMELYIYVNDDVLLW